MMGQHEHIGVVRRLIAPPSLPVVIGPIAADRTKHVPAEDPSPDPGEAASGEVVVQTCVAALLSDLPFEGAGARHPTVERFPTAPERLGSRLRRSGAIAVDRDREAVNAQLRQLLPDELLSVPHVRVDPLLLDLEELARVVAVVVHPLLQQVSNTEFPDLRMLAAP